MFLATDVQCELHTRVTHGDGVGLRRYDASGGFTRPATVVGLDLEYPGVDLRLQMWGEDDRVARKEELLLLNWVER